MLTEQLMVRDLLAHRTGLPSTDFWTFFQDMPLDEQIRRLEAVPVAAPLRTRLIYQNTMFELAGLIIERLSGMRWDLFIRERLWQPIGMNETFGARGQIEETLVYVKPYYFQDGELALAEWDIPVDLAEAAGSVWSSIHDMALWAQFLLRGGVTADGERLITEARFAEMFEPQQLAAPEDFYPTVALTQPHWRSYGLAWFQQDFQGRKIDFHTGSLNGLIAIIGLDRASDRAVIVLGNRDHAEMRHAIMWEVMDNNPPGDRRDWNHDIFDLYAGLAAQKAEKWAAIGQTRLPGTHPSLGLDKYTGAWESPGIGKITIGNSASGLTLKTAKVELPMSHWQLDTFLVDYAPWDLHEFAEFRIGPDGSVSSIELFGESFHPVSKPD
jgi:CubicO group peptidase (beta-lactamase class C family)